MSILAALASISESKAALALFSAGLAGVSVVASDVYTGAKSGLEHRRQKKLENQFDGLLDKENGDRVAAIRSTFAMLRTFDAFVASVSRREKKQAVMISSAGFAVLLFIAVMVWQALGSSGESGKILPADWNQTVIVPLIVVGAIFVALSNAGAALFVRWLGTAQQYFDVFLSVATLKNSDFIKEGDLLEHDKLSYKDVKIDVERRLMSSMIGVLESQFVWGQLAQKRFLMKPEASEGNVKMRGWIELAEKSLKQFPQLEAIRVILPHVLKQASEAKKNVLLYNINAVGRIYVLGFVGGTLDTVSSRSMSGFKPARKGPFHLFQFPKTVGDWRTENIHFDVRDRTIYCAY